MRIESLKSMGFNQYVSVSKNQRPPQNHWVPKIRLREVHVMPFLEKKLGHHHPMKPAGFNHVECECQETRDRRFGREVIHFLYSWSLFCWKRMLIMMKVMTTMNTSNNNIYIYLDGLTSFKTIKLIRFTTRICHIGNLTIFIRFSFFSLDDLNFPINLPRSSCQLLGTKMEDGNNTNSPNFFMRNKKGHIQGCICLPTTVLLFFCRWSFGPASSSNPFYGCLAAASPLGTASAVFAYRQKDDKSPVLGRPHRSWLERVDICPEQNGGGGWRGWWFWLCLCLLCLLLLLFEALKVIIALFARSY